MSVKPMAAWRAVLFNTLLLTICLMLIPAVGLAKVVESNGFEKKDLVTTRDFIEHAEATQVDIHDLFFSMRPYEGTQSCLMCHESEGLEMLTTGHFKWEGYSDRIVGLEGQSHGKNDLINNFCVAVPTNEPRCTQCHAGYGYKDASFDFTNPENVDCLVCHDQSGTYAKNPVTAGLPLPTVDLEVVARSITVGKEPTRKACIGCHAKAGGGDNVKHGDLSTDMIATTREYDVHMGVDGGNMTCTACHGANHDPKTGEVNHGIAGMSLHSVNEGEMKQCGDCHGNRDRIHVGTSVEPMLVEGWHDNLACQVCHIPAIARKISTKTEWYWSDAGQNVDPIPVDPATGRPTYDKKKGTFVWSLNVRPTLRYANGLWNRPVIGFTDKYSAVPIDLGSPVGDYTDSMIYPFKLMVGDQPVDPVTKTILVPHLFGKISGPNPYWGLFDWTLAAQDGANYTGQDFSGTYSFEPTTMLLSVNHEVAPKEMALGMGSNCGDCHASDHIDWQALGWTADPFDGGTRTVTASTQTASVTWAPPLKLPRGLD
ncbi:MAG: tetrathionate reductase family octaheme c-type cytochrome [Xanthomonadales bacterium]|nr:tetrathionate reductase family octaheme c-type cytochrome [Xanthomonadales bacterium]